MGNVSAASGNSIYVNGSSGNDSYNGLNSKWIGGLNGPKSTIKNAIGTVTTNGTVHIARGTYNENNIAINKNMTIIGESQENTIINGQQSGKSIFKIASGVNVTITNLTLTNNKASIGGAIYNEGGTLTVNNSTFTNNRATNTEGGIGGGAIYNRGTLTVNNSTFHGNSASFVNGAGIYNDGTLTVNKSTFTNNIASSSGGAIYNGGTSTVENSIFVGNTAYNYGGGAISNYGTLTVNKSVFTNNAATTNFHGDGGAIHNRCILSVNYSTFTNNTAKYGGAIYNLGWFTVNYNQIIRNTATNGGSAIYNSGRTVDAKYNWWSSNNPDFSTLIYGDSVSYDPWIVLTVTSNPRTIKVGGKSIITADLLHDSNGVYHDPTNGHVPDGLTVNFSSDAKGSLNPTSALTTNGNVNTTFTGLIKGTSTITIMVDQIITTTTMVTINPLSTSMIVISATGLKGKTVNLIATLIDSDGKPFSGANVQFSLNGVKVGTVNTDSKGIATLPYTITQNSGTYTILANYLGNDINDVSSNTNELKVTNIPTAKASLTGGLYNTNKVVKLTMNEPGKIYYTINGSTPTITSKLYTEPLTIKSTTTLKFIAVNTAGNISPVYTNKYTIDKTAPKVVSSRQKNNSKVKYHSQQL